MILNNTWVGRSVLVGKFSSRGSICKVFIKHGLFLNYLQGSSFLQGSHGSYWRYRLLARELLTWTCRHCCWRDNWRGLHTTILIGESGDVERVSPFPLARHAQRVAEQEAWFFWAYIVITNGENNVTIAYKKNLPLECIHSCILSPTSSIIFHLLLLLRVSCYVSLFASTIGNILIYYHFKHKLGRVF